MTHSPAPHEQPHRLSRRTLGAVAATLAALVIPAAPALAVPPPEPIDPGPSRVGSALSAFPSVSESLSTAQVITISLLVSLAVALVVVTLAYLVNRRIRATRRVLAVPPQRSLETAPAGAVSGPVGTARTR
jgi:hypothetical protein